MHEDQTLPMGPSGSEKKRNIVLTLCTMAFFLSFLAGMLLVLRGEGGPAVSVAGDGAERPGIAVLDIEGVIEYSSHQGFMQTGGRGAPALVETIRRLGENPLVRGLVVRINSPGGSIGATQEVYLALRRFRESKKPVVISMGDVAASGGYYIACAADSIYANAGTMTGSIGVIMSAPDMHGLYEWAQINWNVIKSGRFKDILSPFRGMTDEERQLLTGMVQDAYAQFFDAVHTSRSIEKVKLENLAQGQIFSGRQAKEAGLVDEIGDFESALLAAGKLAGLPGRPHVIREKGPTGLMDLLGLAVNNLAASRTFVIPGLQRGLPAIAYCMPGAVQ
jgi:protease-4